MRQLGNFLVIMEAGRSLRKITWRGEAFLAVGLTNDFAIATQEQFDNFEQSTAHRMPDGTIMQFGKVIGSADEITFI